MLNFTRRHEGTYYRAFPWAKYLVSRGHDVTLASDSPSFSLRAQEVEEDGVRILQTSNFLDGDLLMKRLSGVDGWGPLDILQRHRELRRGAYDVVHTFEHHPCVSAPVLWSRRTLPFLHVADWCDHYGRGGFREADYRPYRLSAVYNRVGAPFRKWMDHVEKKLRVTADAVTVISTYLRERARSFGIPEERIHLVSGSADVDHIKPVPRDEALRHIGLDPSTPVAAFFGSGQFDVGLLLEATALLRSERPDLLLLIVGKEQEWIRKRAIRLGIEANVRQTGWCPDVDLPYYLGAADVFLLPMTDNPVNRARWPNKIGAYMAAGRPTICADVGDVASLVRSKEIGFVCEPTTGGFVQGIRNVLADEEGSKQMGVRARQVAESEFALNVQGSEIEALYLRLLESACIR